MMNPYALLDVFSLDEAVQAITDIVQPKTPEEKNTVALTRRSLQGDIHSKKLKATVTEVQKFQEERVGMRRISIDDTTDRRPIIQHPYTETIIRITRADLLAWCEQKGTRPALLFSESPPAEKPLNDSERKTLLSIIRALAELNGIKSTSDAYRKEAGALLAELASKGIRSPCNDKTLAKHLTAAFKSR